MTPGTLSRTAAGRGKRRSALRAKILIEVLAIRNGCNSLKIQHGDTF